MGTIIAMIATWIVIICGLNNKEFELGKNYDISLI